MRKHKITTIILLLLLSTVVQAQFQFRIGSPYYDMPRKVIQTQNGDFIIVGETDGYGSSGNAFMMKVNASGTINWIRDYSGVNLDEIYDVIELPDASLIMCGETYSYGSGGSDAFLMKTNSSGVIIWAWTYGGINDEYFNKVLNDGTGGFYVNAILPTGTGTGAAIIRMDSIGNVIWGKYTTSAYINTDILKTSSSGVLLINGDDSYTANLDIYKLSPSGGTIWSKEYKPSPSGSGLNGPSLAEIKNGNILINYAYASSSTLLTTLDICVITLDSTGNYISNKAYGGNYADNWNMIKATSDGGFILQGVTNSAGNGANDVCLIKATSSGTVSWANAYGTPWDEAASSVFQLANHGYVFSGQTVSTGSAHDSLKIYLVKTDSLGETWCNTVPWVPQVNSLSVSTGTPIGLSSITLTRNSLPWTTNLRSMYSYNICGITADISNLSYNENSMVYPNPFTSTISIEMSSINYSHSEVFIQNVLGEIVYHQQIINDHTVIDLSFLPKGIYIYDMLIDGKRNRQKILKQ